MHRDDFTLRCSPDEGRNFCPPSAPAYAGVAAYGHSPGLSDEPREWVGTLVCRIIQAVQRGFHRDGEECVRTPADRCLVSSTAEGCPAVDPPISKPRHCRRILFGSISRAPIATRSVLSRGPPALRSRAWKSSARSRARAECAPPMERST